MLIKGILRQLILGVFSQHGIDLEQNDKNIIEYYQKAADKGFPPAINNLVDKYETEQGVTKDLNKAFELYQIAAEHNIAAAQWSLALMYLNGAVVAKDEAKAKDYLLLAQENGWDAAATLLADLNA